MDYRLWLVTDPDGRISLTILSEAQLTADDYRLLGECVDAVQRFAAAVRKHPTLRPVPDIAEDDIKEITIVDADE